MQGRTNLKSMPNFLFLPFTTSINWFECRTIFASGSKRGANSTFVISRTVFLTSFQRLVIMQVFITPKGTSVRNYFSAAIVLDTNTKAQLRRTVETFTYKFGVIKWP